MLTPPTTSDPALNRFLEEVASTMQDRARPEEGWSLSDFASSVSEVISDKRDLIDIVTKYDNIEGLSEEVEAEIARLESEIQDSMDLLASVNSKSAQFAEVMAWWDQNYTVIFDAQEALSIFQEIHGAMAEHRDLLSQATAAKEAAERAAAETATAEESARTAAAAAAAAQASETSATEAAARANASEIEVGESREYVSELHAALSPGGEIMEDFEWIANRSLDSANQAVDARDAAAASATSAGASATAAQSHADRAATEAGAAAQIAAQEKIAALVGSAPADLDTIYELASAFADRSDAIATIQAALANRVVGNYSLVVSPTIPGANTPTNQITFVVEGI